MMKQAGRPDPHVIVEEGCSTLSWQNQDLKNRTTFKLMAELLSTWEAFTRIPSLASSYKKWEKSLKWIAAWVQI